MVGRWRDRFESSLRARFAANQRAASSEYHVMARGNERRAVFRDDQDRQRFLQTLAEMVERFGVRVHAYCLMASGNWGHISCF